MHSNATLHDALVSLEDRLHFGSMQHKDHWLLLLGSALLLVVAYHIWGWMATWDLKYKLKRCGVFLLNLLLCIPARLKAGMVKLRRNVHDSKRTSISPVYKELPHLTDEQIKARLEEVLRLDTKREKIGKEGGNFYFPLNEDHKDFVQSLASKFLYTNIMHFDSCCGTLLVENELINFFAPLLHAPSTYVGTCTTGGSESILLSMLAYREYGLKKGIARPEVACFESIHVAFFKAAFYFNIPMRVVKVNPDTGEGDVDELMDVVNENTVAILLSGGSYAHGTVDPVGAVNARIKDTDIWIHVDSCLGGFMSVCSSLKGDHRIPAVDFRNSRVGTISIDPHKYGESPKGCSVLLFRNEELKKGGIFVKRDWNGGVYATPGLPGSRGSAPFVGAWISLVRQGKDGLLQTYDRLVEARDKLVADLKSIPELQVIGKCISGVVSFGTRKNSGISIYDLNEEIKAYGWHFSLMQQPYVAHITVSRNNMSQLPQLKDDLVKCIAAIRKKPNTGKESMYAQLYGSLVKLPDTQMIDDALRTAIVEINRLEVPK